MTPPRLRKVMKGLRLFRPKGNRIYPERQDCSSSCLVLSPALRAFAYGVTAALSNMLIPTQLGMGLAAFAVFQ